MAKLIHASALSYIKLNETLYSNSDYTTEGKKSLMFTEDGYIVAKGHEYRIGTGINSDTLAFVNNVLGLKEFSTSPAKDTQAIYPIAIDKYGRITASGTAITPLVASNIKNFIISNGASTNPTEITYDPDNAEKKVKFVGGTNKFTITDMASGGSSFDVNITPSISGGSLAATNGKVVTALSIDSSGSPSGSTKTDLFSIQAGGYTANSSAAIGSLSTSQTLNYFINAILNEIAGIKSTATAAMTFIDGVSALPEENLAVGNTYKVTASFNIPAASSLTGVAITPKVGDTIIYNSNNKWVVIPSGDETFTKFSEDTTNHKLELVIGGVTKSINITGESFGVQTPNTVLAGPSSGSSTAVPSFRSLVEADIPGLSASKITSGTIDAARLPKISATTISGVLSVANGGTGKSAWTKGGIVYANEINALSLIEVLSNSSSGILKQSVNGSGVVTYSWIANNLVVADATAGTSNSTTTSSSTAYINLLEGTTKRTGISIVPGSGIKVTYTSGAITIANTRDANVTTSLYIGANNTTEASAETSNGGTYLKLFEGSTKNHAYLIKGSGATSVASDSNGNITITSQNTWRPVFAWDASQLNLTNDTIDDLLEQGSTGVKGLAFGSTFGYSSSTINSKSVAVLDLVWGEVDSSGTLNYSI